MFDVFDENFDDDDEQFLMEAEIVETKIVSSQNTTVKRVSNDNLGELTEDIAGVVSLKKPRILDSECQVQSPQRNPNLDVLLADISRLKPKCCVKRKFPGPAGVEPQSSFNSNRSSALLIASNNEKNTESYSQSRHQFSTTEQFFTSQLTSEWFDAPAWLKMNEDIQNTLTEDHTRILRKFSISWILKKVERNINFCTKKIPFLCVVLVSIKNEESYSHRAVFQDVSGNISGSIHHKVVEKYCSAIRPGSILVLRQVGIFSPAHGKHYIFVTENNVVSIYDTNTEGTVNIIQVQNLSWLELAKEASLKEANNDIEPSERREDLNHNKFKRSAALSICAAKKPNEHFPQTTIENLPLDEIPGIQMHSQQSNKSSEISSNSASLEKCQSSSSKQFVFKKITPPAHDSNVKPKHPETSLTSSSALDLFTNFDEGEWIDDEFESIVKDINM